MHRLFSVIAGITLATTALSPLSLQAQLVVDSLTGPVTAHEINAFKSYVQNIAPPTYGGGNIWVFGSSGKVLESCGMMYEASQDTAILDRMIYYCDVALSQRNDLASAANGGQQTTWTGNIDPVWPSSAQGTTPAQAGVEQGDVLSHMVYCSRLILQNPALWNVTVPIGDPNGYGATYKQRALTYVQQGDYVIDHWILPYFIATADSNHYYFPGAPNTYMAGKPAPWNQAWMLTNAFVRLTQCHVLLADNPARVAKYDSIVQSNINWFRSSLTPNTSHIGTPCWTWAYQLPSGMEDTNHAAYDSEGLWIAYFSGRYGLSFNDLLPFANTYFDIVLDTVTAGKFAGRVDGTTGTGHSGGDNYVRDEYIYLTEFRPEKYDTVGIIEINTGHIASSTPIVARLLWEKNRRYAASPALPAAPSGLTSTTLSGSAIRLNWTDNSANETNFVIQRSTDSLTWSVRTTIVANLTSWTDTGLTAATQYYYRIASSNAAGNSTWSNATSATTAPQTLPNIALSKPAVVSNYYLNSSAYSGDKAVDGNTTTRWATDNSITAATLEVDLGADYTFGKTTTLEYQSRVASYKIQYWDGSAWQDAYTGTTIGATHTDSFPPVTGSKVRLNILTITGTKGPSIYEFEVFGFLASALTSKKNTLELAPRPDFIQDRNNTLSLHVSPNPVTSGATIHYSVNEEGPVNLGLFTIQGQPLQTLVNATLRQGEHESVLNAGSLPAGSYVLRLTTGHGIKTLIIAVTH